MRDPDLQGPAGRAWRIVEHRPDPPPEQKATLRAWIVTGGFHPMWSFWMVGVVHLRPIVGVRPPYRQYPQAEFEGLSSPPGVPGDHPDPDDLDTLKPLVPPDVIYQFHGCSDEQAADLSDLSIAAICAGHASPDSPLALLVIDGEFDATKAESDEWAASPEGQAVMREFGGRLPREGRP